ncbi:MAG: hypothetical protein ACOX6H_03985 [Christensenellales bacterium]|jgi:hypothetical protein
MAENKIYTVFTKENKIDYSISKNLNKYLRSEQIIKGYIESNYIKERFCTENANISHEDKCNLFKQIYILTGAAKQGLLMINWHNLFNRANQEVVDTLKEITEKVVAIAPELLSNWEKKLAKKCECKEGLEK